MKQEMKNERKHIEVRRKMVEKLEYRKQDERRKMV